MLIENVRALLNWCKLFSKHLPLNVGRELGGLNRAQN